MAIKVVASTAIGADNTVGASTAVASKVAETTADRAVDTVLLLDVLSARLKVADKVSSAAQPKGVATAVEILAEPDLVAVDIQPVVEAAAVDTPPVDNVSGMGRNVRTNGRSSITNAENGLTVVAKGKVSKVMSTNDSLKTTSRYRPTDVSSQAWKRLLSQPLQLIN